MAKRCPLNHVNARITKISKPLGRMWCPDCRSHPKIEEVMKKRRKVEGIVFYIGVVKRVVATNEQDAVERFLDELGLKTEKGRDKAREWINVVNQSTEKK